MVSKHDGDDNIEIAEFLVKYGLPLILFVLLVLIIISILMIKFIMRKNYFDYVTEKLLELSEWEVRFLDFTVLFLLLIIVYSGLNSNWKISS